MRDGEPLAHQQSRRRKTRQEALTPQPTSWEKAEFLPVLRRWIGRRAVSRAAMGMGGTWLCEWSSRTLNQPATSYTNMLLPTRPVEAKRKRPETINFQQGSQIVKRFPSITLSRQLPILFRGLLFLLIVDPAGPPK